MELRMLCIIVYRMLADLAGSGSVPAWAAPAVGAVGAASCLSSGYRLIGLIILLHRVGKAFRSTHRD